MMLALLAFSSTTMAWGQYFTDRNHNQGSDSLMVYKQRLDSLVASDAMTT